MDHNSDHPEEILATIRPGLHVTTTCMQVSSRHFQLSAIRNIQSHKAAHGPLTRQMAFLAAAGSVMLAVFARHMHPAGIGGAAIAVIALAGFAMASAQRRPPRMELWATYRGHVVQIFGSADQLLFAAVERQLRRSVIERKLAGIPTLERWSLGAETSERIQETFKRLEAVDGTVNPATNIVDRALTFLGPPPNWHPGEAQPSPVEPVLLPSGAEK